MISIPTRLCTAVDSAVLWRLGMISVAPRTGVQEDPLDPEAFWRASRVLDPAPLSARLVNPPPWARLLPRASRPTFMELVGPSRGPGDHWGATNLKAHVALSPRADAPFVLLLHGYAVPAPWYEERQMQVLARRGISSARLEMPFHLSRRLPRQPVGAGYFSSDTVRTLAVLSQTTEDSSAVLAWARDELGMPRIGVHGVSLGGLIGGLLAANMEMDSAILISPPCDLAAIMMEYAPIRLRRELDIVDGRGGPWGADTASARATLARELAPVTLRHLRPRMRPDRIVVVLANHDRIVGAGPVRDMATTWGAEVWPYSTGHVTLLAARGLGGRIHDRLERDLVTAPEPAAALAG
ncbi:MAG TPA: alpha/beta hydrolase family protein [Candidatus Dormibacteraeota bacterium]|nr:alpha/beta hydrolase family protein [Candidatus Dormibacteraeota bacterium]